MSSIYDDAPFNPNAAPQQTSPVSAEPVQAEYWLPPSAEVPPPQKKQKSGCSCFGCLLGCLGVTVVVSILGGIGLWVLAKRLPDLAREAVSKGIEESDLPAEDKQMVMQQVDRLVDGYKQGKVDFQKLGKLAEEFSQSPLMGVLIAFAARVKYIEESGLSPEEKAAAERTLQRLARGVIAKKISQSELDGALDHISTKAPNGSRRFKEEVDDEQLRAFLTESKRLADEAKVTEEEVRVNVAAELKKLVDDALGETSDDVAVPVDGIPVEKLPAERPDGLQPN